MHARGQDNLIEVRDIKGRNMLNMQNKYNKLKPTVTRLSHLGWNPEILKSLKIARKLSKVIFFVSI